MAKERVNALAAQAKEAQPEASRGVNTIKKHVELKTGIGQPKLAWDLQAPTMVEMMTKIRNICKEHGKKWPRDVMKMD